MCIFCDIANKKLETNIVYEDEMVMAFLDNDPINTGHVLVITKEHYCDIDEMPIEVLNHLMEVSKRLVIAIKKVYQPDGYSINMKLMNKKKVGRKVRIDRTPYSE